jgi:hypothetical protein
MAAYGLMAGATPIPGGGPIFSGPGGFPEGYGGPAGTLPIPQPLPPGSSFSIKLDANGNPVLDAYGDPVYETDEFGNPLIRSEEQQKLKQTMADFLDFEGAFGPTEETEEEEFSENNGYTNNGYE